VHSFAFSATFRYLSSYFSPNSAKSQLQVRNEPNSAKTKSKCNGARGWSNRESGHGARGWSSRSQRLSSLSPPALGRGPRGDGAAGLGGCLPSRLQLRAEDLAAGIEQQVPAGVAGVVGGRAEDLAWDGAAGCGRGGWAAAGCERGGCGGRLRAGDRSLLPSRVAVEWSGDFFAVGPTCKTREIRRRRRPDSILSKVK
jgi:hypothetical protein